MYNICIYYVPEDVTLYYKSITWKTDVTISQPLAVYPVINLPLL